jgi:chromosome segregation ATPase
VGGPPSFRSTTLESYQCTNTRVGSSQHVIVEITDSRNRIQETLRKKFAELADDFRERLRAVSLELSAVEGPLEEQQRQTEKIQTRIPALLDALSTVEAAEAECVAAKVEENDYTVFTCQDLEFELELVVQSIAKKISFIDNQARMAFLPKPFLYLTKVAADRVTQYDQSDTGTD